MRFLFVVHYYLPYHQAGTELYTRALARQFQKEGHQVFIFTSEDQSQSGWVLKQDSYEGIKIFRLYHSEPFDFKSSYCRADFDKLFGKILDELKPDVVHFQHLFRLSLGFVKEAYQRQIPSVMTLADYWLICPAIIMLKPEDKICPGPAQTEECVNCPHAFSAFYPGDASQGRIFYHKFLERALALGHKFKRQLPPTWVNALRIILRKKSQEQTRRLLLQERWQEMREMVGQISLFLAPSKFLRELMINSGMIPEDKILYSDYGFEDEKFKSLNQERARTSQSTLSLGFIGTLVRHKGLHILLQAFRQIPRQANLELKIFGSEKDFPGYVRELKKIAGKDPRIKWMGRIENDEVPRALSEIDVLVVPSLWYENSPLSIHEAFLARVPVLCSNLGGMAELVQSGGGLTFQTNNPKELSKKIIQLISQPELLQNLRKSIPAVKTIVQNYQELLAIYSKVRSKIS